MPIRRILAHVRVIAAATDCPVSVDLEKGFGDAPADVAATIRLAAAAGAVGGSIEDATGDRDKPLYDVTAAIERVVVLVVAAVPTACESRTLGDSPSVTVSSPG